MRKLVFATKNAGKMREIREILKDLPIEILSMKEAGIDMEITEDGTTFEENALIKARAVWKAYTLEHPGEQITVLADDSGLEVDALNKEPGIYSARYLGEETPYSVKNASIIERLNGVEGAGRSARFVCAIAAVLPDGCEKCVLRTMEGVIGYREEGDGGFGYDPIFILPKYGCTTASLTMEQKNEESHRGKALRAMKEELKANLN